MKVHLYTSSEPILPVLGASGGELERECQVSCNILLRNPKFAFIWNETQTGSSLDLRSIRNLCRRCRESVEAELREGPRYLYGLTLAEEQPDATDDTSE